MPTSDGREVRAIVCYGDSNTWGHVPGCVKRRHPRTGRWPAVLGALLGDKYEVINEGLSGRTSVFDDPLEGALTVDKNGRKTIGAVLDTHSPVDLVIIMLGSNDLKQRFSVPAKDIAAGIELLVRIARDPEFGPGLASAPDILVICPPPIEEVGDVVGAMFAGGAEKSRNLRREFAAMGQKAGVEVLYAEDHVQSDPTDGIHLSVASHGLLAKGVAAWITNHFA